MAKRKGKAAVVAVARDGAAEDGHGCSNPTCPVHTAFAVTLVAVKVVSALSDRLGEAEFNFDHRLLAWDASDERGEDAVVEMAFMADGQPVVRVAGETEGAHGAIGLCLTMGVVCLDAEGEAMFGEAPEPDPWAEIDAERAGRAEAHRHAAMAGAAEGMKRAFALHHGIDPDDVQVVGPDMPFPGKPDKLN